jgi:2-polyprenyl-6-methoxyphenol hydroxylase-like FAD-dependent oxidoreductase
MTCEPVAVSRCANIEMRPSSGRIMDIDVLIVGAGPVGLALATDLASRGRTVRIVDRSKQVFPGSRGKGLQPRGFEALYRLGLGSALLDEGTSLKFRRYDGSTPIEDVDPYEGVEATPAAPYVRTLLLPQYRTEAIIRDRLAALGVQVELGTELIAFSGEGDQVSATVRSADREETQIAKFLVGCDGGRSFVRRALGLPFEGRSEETERCLFGDLQVEGLSTDVWHVWPDPEKGYLALCPLLGGKLWQFQAALKPGEEYPEPTVEACQQVFDARAGVPGVRLSNPTWLSNWSLSVRMTEQMRSGRIFLAGDAAHVHPPAGGQGMNTGIQDGLNLSWKLAAVLGGAPDALLDTYAAERVPIIHWVLDNTSGRHRTVMHQGGGGATRANAANLQLQLNYADSPLSVDDGDAERPLRAGDRAPDARLSRSGSEVRLFDLCIGAPFVAIAGGKDGAAVVAAATARWPTWLLPHVIQNEGDAVDGALCDVHGDFRRAYGLGRAEIAVLRPDGNVGAILPAAGDALQCYLGETVGLT